MLLTLPRINDQIPPEIVFDNPNPHYLCLAEEMTAARLISADDLAGIARSELRFPTVCDLICTAWERELGGLFEFEQLDTHVALNLPWMNGSDGYDDRAPEKPVCSVTLDSSSSPPLLLIGSIVTALDELQAGLGVTVLSILTEVLAMFCSPCTPLSAQMLAAHLYWGGATNEEEALQWYDDEDADLPRAAELFHELPSWTWSEPTPKRLSRRRLEAAAQHYKTHRFGGLLAGVSELSSCLSRRRPTPMMLSSNDAYEYDGESFAPPAVLRWSEDDSLLRIYDDFLNAWMNSGCGAPYQLFVRFSLEAKEIREALARIRNTGRLCQSLDRVLVAIAELQG